MQADPFHDADPFNGSAPFSHGGTGPGTVAWAVIALPLLALWVPAAVWCATAPSGRRLLLPLVAGVATAAVLAYALATRTVTAESRGHTVGYSLGLPQAALIVVGYFLATVGSLLLSGDRGLVAAVALIGAAGLRTLARWDMTTALRPSNSPSRAQSVIVAWRRS
ncbi:DUF6629 family protein [Streptomyces sp. NPDC006692]|uniref:DUF6629 family protein n=1 Tax=Streptomyces sp. NPDC006692 TaxID=3364758 RepID=UPI0036CDFD0D